MNENIYADWKEDFLFLQCSPNYRYRSRRTDGRTDGLYRSILCSVCAIGFSLRSSHICRFEMLEELRVSKVDGLCTD